MSSAVPFEPSPDSQPNETTTRMLVSKLPPGEKDQRAVALTVSKVLSVPAPPVLEGVLNELPAVIPVRLARDDAAALAELLKEYGAEVELDPNVQRPSGACERHPNLDSCASCHQCSTALCAVCRRQVGERVLCAACADRQHRSKLFYQMRVYALLVVFACVLLYAWRDVGTRRARNQWDTSLSVGLVVVRDENLDPAALDALQSEVRKLENKLGSEFERYQPGHVKPFLFTIYGPIDRPAAPPRPEPGWFGAARFAAELWWFLRGINAGVGFDSSNADAVVYLFARRPLQQDRQFVEGLSQEGGRVGIVEVDLDRSMAAFALFVATHELLHTLGATDKYDSSGYALVPTGLADPDRVPLYPQHQAEIMARNIAVGPKAERPPTSLDDLRVGRFTAAEIGWIVR